MTSSIELMRSLIPAEKNTVDVVRLDTDRVMKRGGWLKFLFG